MNIYGQVAVIRLKCHLMRSFCTNIRNIRMGWCINATNFIVYAALYLDASIRRNVCLKCKKKRLRKKELSPKLNAERIEGSQGERWANNWHILWEIKSKRLPYFRMVYASVQFNMILFAPSLKNALLNRLFHVHPKSICLHDIKTMIRTEFDITIAMCRERMWMWMFTTME